ncbi:MAG: L-aspartate oxidase [Candidatus Tokpelaia sp. JSC161]|jgi:L-aspartate oxidase|nr:MAG: L-aspartate oxidase [Candidatus Tokpelaia sp. JSC161]
MTGGMIRKETIVVVGSGLAGLVTALELRPNPVLLITQGNIGMLTSTRLAQGGIAAAWSKKDSTLLHVEDTVRAGDGLCDKGVVHSILSDGYKAIRWLERQGVPFDKDKCGEFSLGLEAAHSHRRILHVAGDRIGKAVIDILRDAVLHADSITVMENTQVSRLFVRDNRIFGLSIQKGMGISYIHCSHVVLATGGIGGLYGNTTNPVENCGQGILLAAEVGAVLADLEFIQFHPTGLDVPLVPRLLISEAVRGEGGILVNDKGQRFLKEVRGKELAPRDVLVRAMTREMSRGRKIFLDARPPRIRNFLKRFPAISAGCRAVGINPEDDLIPVSPVEHFHMGGIATDIHGYSSVDGLWVVGEAASTGLHGANRLASNSLLEATVMGIRVARSINHSELDFDDRTFQDIILPLDDVSFVRDIMQRNLGVFRNEVSLLQAISFLLPRIEENFFSCRIAKLALMIAVSALSRCESRGAHSREDYPTCSLHSLRSFLTWEEAYRRAQQYVS